MEAAGEGPFLETVGLGKGELGAGGEGEGWRGLVEEGRGVEFVG